MKYDQLSSVYVCVAVCLPLLSAATSSGTFYHVTSQTHPCRVTSSLNGTVDVICQFPEGFVTSLPAGNSHVCTSQTVLWQRVDSQLPANLTDNTKYGIWEAVPGWKMAERQRISLLRVRRLQPEDLGLYQCRVQCLSQGRVYRNHYLAELCLELTPVHSICTIKPLGNKCSWSFGNGMCDPECDSEENLYDGFDCCPPVGDCAGTDSQNCPRDFSNGVCDPECDSRACVWDGGDCIDKQLEFVSDQIVINLAPWFEHSGRTVDVKALGLSLSKLLKTIIRVLPGDWSDSRSHDADATWHKPDRRGYDAPRQIFLRIDNTKCSRRCFYLAENAAKFIDLALKNNWNPGIPIASIAVLSKTVNRCATENSTDLQLDQSDPGEAPVHHIYSHSHTQSDPDTLPAWLVVTVVAGGLVIVAIVVLIVIIVLRIRKLSRESQRPRAVASLDNIQCEDKTSPLATDV